MSDLEPFGAEQPRNPFGGNGQLVQQQSSAIASVEEARAIGELKAEIMIAQMYPRNEQQCMDLILNDCGRLSLAEEAVWKFPRGNQQITGPSIRLLEAIARRWRNLSSGWKVIYQDDERSEVISYCWDKETNDRDEVRFPVPHYRWAKGKKEQLVDPRDIYEAVANVAQRRKRACMEHVIPAEVVSAAIAACEQTLAANIDTSVEGLKKMLAAFAAFNVTQKQIEARLRCRIDAISPGQFLQLRGIYTSLKEGVSEPSAWFEPEPRPTRQPAPPVQAAEVPQEPPPPAQEPPPAPPPTPEPPAPPAEEPPPPPAAAAPTIPSEPPGNGPSFEATLLNEHGEPIDGEVFLDPFEYAKAILAAFEASPNPAGFVEQNRDGIEDARKADPQADALLDSVEATPPPGSTPAPQPELVDDKDARAANAMIVHVSTLRGADIITYSKSPAVLVPIGRWQREGRQDLVDRVKAVFSKRLEETRDRRDG